MALMWPLFLLPSLVSAYTWRFSAPPAQCQDLSISIDGAGTPPYRVLIIPFGPSPLPNNIEARRIISQDFNGADNKITFPLRYPADSQLIAVVSDASGFGSGGTSVAARVLAGNNDSSCFDATANVQPAFVFSIDPPNQIVQCTPTRIWWDNATVVGTTQFLGIIPGGNSFQIPVSGLTSVPSQGFGFTWTPSVRGGTTLQLVGGDGRGTGSGGSTFFIVSSGVSPNNGCLNDQSPSSTPGSPAGGSYATSAPGQQQPGYDTPSDVNRKRGVNVRVLVGEITGALAVVVLGAVLVCVFYRRRQRRRRSVKEVPVDLLRDHEDGDGARTNELPPFYTPEPFVLPEASQPSHSSHDLGRPLSMATSTTDWGLGGIARSPTPDASLAGGPVPSGATSTSRKSAGGPRSLRPVNIVQHDDAGPSAAVPEEEGEAETIELPPAYTNLKAPAEVGQPAAARATGAP